MMERSTFESAFRPPCACGAPAVHELGVCLSCADQLRAVTHPTTKDATLRLIADIAEGSTTANSLPNLARLARHGLTLKG